MTSTSIQILLVIGICLVALFFAFWAGYKEGYEKCFKDTEEEVKETIENNQIFS